MQEVEIPSTKLLCPNGHGLQPAKRKDSEWLLSCSCTRGNVLPSKAKTGIQTPEALQQAKPLVTTFVPEVEYEERAPQEQEVGSEYVRPTAREAGEYAAFVANNN
jgi:hypothetical protein